MKKSLANIVAFLIGQGVATFGAFIVMYSIVWHVTLETKSGTMLALLSVAQTLPAFFIAPVAGVLADRYNRRKVAIIADSFVMLATLFLAIFLNSISANIAILLVVVFIRALGQGFQEPVMLAIVPLITPEKHLVRVNAIMDMLMSVTMLASPAIAAALMAVTTLGNICLVTVVASIIGILIMVFFVKVPDVVGEEALEGAGFAQSGTSAESSITAKEPFFTQFINGFKYIRRSPFLLRMSILMLVFFFFSAPVANLGPLLIVRNWGDNTFFLSVSEMAFSIGMIAGGLLIAAWGGFKNRTVTFALAILIIGAQHFFFAGAVFISVWVFIVTFALCGVVIPFFNTPGMTLAMVHSDEKYMGRVMSVFSMAMGLGQPLASAIFGPLADIVDINVIILVPGLALILCGVYALKSKVMMKAGLKRADEPAN